MATACATAFIRYAFLLSGNVSKIKSFVHSLALSELRESPKKGANFGCIAYKVGRVVSKWPLREITINRPRCSDCQGTQLTERHNTKLSAAEMNSIRVVVRARVRSPTGSLRRLTRLRELA
jgi:hypothetical protein